MFLSRLQNLSLRKRKILLWATVALIALGLLFFWGRGMKERFQSFQAQEFIEDLNLPDLHNNGE